MSEIAPPSRPDDPSKSPPTRTPKTRTRRAMIALVVGAALLGTLLMVTCVAVLVDIEGGEAKDQFQQIGYCLDHPKSPKCAAPSP